MSIANSRLLIKWLAILGLLALVGVVAAQSLPIPQLTVGVKGATGKPGDVSSSLQILALLTVLSLAPAILMLTTAFTRIVIIFSFLRSALGTPSIPPNQVLVGLSLFLTFFVMKPTWDKVYVQAIQPLSSHQAGFGMDQAIAKAQGPLRDFMLKSTYESDLKLFLD